MILTAKKSILARLLANENLNVIQDNVETASFNVKTRQLTLPFWKDMGNDVVDMLVGHEVAHALFTPLDGITSYRERIPGIPHDYVNIVEDIRIEKLILRKYPGLLGNFKRGYLYMIDQDLFGTKGRDIKKIPFMDRLNLSMKARDHLEVPFTPEESKYVEMARAVETWEDVLRVCKELYAFVKTQAEEQRANPKAFARKILILMDSPADQDGAEAKEINLEEYDKIIDMRESVQDEGEADSKVSKTGNGTQGDQVEHIDPDQVLTQKSYDQKQGSLSEAASGKSFGQPISKALAKVAYTPVEEVIADRESNMNRAFMYTYPEKEYTEFKSEMKIQVTAMVKEFEMRKAAYRSARARTSTKGSLDVNKLHSYKYNDHLFKQMTTLADGKNHGMMMLVDYSGSMHQYLPSVIRQLMILVNFCKRVNIPFQVFGFTNGRHRQPYINAHVDTTRAHIDINDTNIFELFNSGMTKAQYEVAMKTLFAQTVRGVSRYENAAVSRFEKLGATPLNQALFVMDKLINVFRSTHNVEKMNFVTLTDGDGQKIRLTGDVGYMRHQCVEVAGKMINLTSGYSGRETTSQIIEAFSAKGIKTINYFITNQTGLVHELKYNFSHLKSTNAYTNARREVSKTGLLTIDNNLGYSRRFIMKVNNQDLVNDELNIADDASASQIAREFGKHVGNKNKVRKIAQKFAEIVS